MSNTLTLSYDSKQPAIKPIKSIRFFLRNFLYAFLKVWVLHFFFISNASGEANFKINYKDGASEGFYEQASADPIGGNTGTTVGDQRRIALEYAVSILEQVIESNVTVEVDANFEEMGGSNTSASLAFAGPYSLNWNFEGAPQQNLYYPIALANKLANKDLDPNNADVEASFNSSLDQDTVLGDSGWYYGLDKRGSSNDTDFVTVALHELLHGLGFLSLLDVSSGEKFACANDSECISGMDDLFTLYLERAGASPSPLLEMSDAQRQSAMTADGKISWAGSKTSSILSGWANNGTSGNNPLIFTPFPLESGSTLSHFDVSLSPNSLMEPYYIHANHEMGLAAAVLADIGWGNLADINLTFTATSESNNLITTDLILENYGPDNAPSHLVEFTANNTNFSSSTTSSNGSCTTSSRLVSCQMRQLNSGDNASISISVENTENSSVTAQLETSHVEVSILDNQASLSLNELSGGSNPSDNSDNPNNSSEDSTDNTSQSINPNNINTVGASSGGSYSPLSIFILFTLMLLRPTQRKKKGRYLSQPFPKLVNLFKD